MKIGNINKIEEYPVDYSDLPQDKQDIILNFFAEQQEKANDYYEKHIVAETQEERSKLLGLYNHQLDVIIGAKLILALLGVKMEYNWPGNRGKWILATKADYEKNENAADDDCLPQSSMRREKYAGWPKPRTNADNTREKDLLPRVHMIGF